MTNNDQREWDIVCPQCSRPERITEDSYTFHGTVIYEIHPDHCAGCGLSFDAVPWKEEPWNGPEN